jgi:L-seryl-tRNA(Ser) seleniumtransferase
LLGDNSRRHHQLSGFAMKDRDVQLRRLPAIDRLLMTAPLQDLATRCPALLLTEAARTAVAAVRAELLAGREIDSGIEAVAARAARLAEESLLPTLRPVLNLSGTLLHTNLGRAPLSSAALAAVAAVSRGYSSLELDLESGARGHRDSHIENLLCRLTGAEAATVVNNNAGAVLLALTSLAKGKEAIVSRGELVEVGGAFRIPEVMESGGVILREVGATNKTRPADYARAIGPETALLLKVHTSNYRIVGFTESVASVELVALAGKHGLPVLEDLGSGMLLDLTPFGLPKEPTVAEAVAAGIDVVTFSGDKLLGGPQAGLIVGKRAAIETIRRHPLMRALRCDKMTLTALEATLRHYLDPAEALREIPLLRMLAATPAELKSRCRRLQRLLTPVLNGLAELSIVPEPATVGGGALPTTELPGHALALKPHAISINELAERLRHRPLPVIGRIRDDLLLFNPRTLFPEEEALLVAALRDALGGAA